MNHLPSDILLHIHSYCDIVGDLSLRCISKDMTPTIKSIILSRDKTIITGLVYQQLLDEYAASNGYTTVLKWLSGCRSLTGDLCGLSIINNQSTIVSWLIERQYLTTSSLSLSRVAFCNDQSTIDSLYDGRVPDRWNLLAAAIAGNHKFFNQLSTSFRRDPSYLDLCTQAAIASHVGNLKSNYFEGLWNRGCCNDGRCSHMEFLSHGLQIGSAIMILRHLAEVGELKMMQKIRKMSDPKDWISVTQWKDEAIQIHVV